MISVTVSALSKFATCPKRSKLEGLHKVGKNSRSKSIRTGNAMHWEYESPFKCFDRRLLRHNLECVMEYGAFQRTLGILDEVVLIRGRPDDYKIVGKKVSLIEVKTTSKKRLYQYELGSAVLQLKIYMWLMESYIKKLGYELAAQHYVEIYSQKDGALLKRVIVYQPITVKELRHIFNVWQGLERMTYPPMWICKRCPKQVKKHCDRYQYYFGGDR